MFGEISPKQKGLYQASGLYLIESKMLTAASTSFSFFNIPQTYTNLYLIGSLRTTVATGSNTVQAQYNGDTGANYSWQYYGAAGGTFAASSAGSQTGTDFAEVPSANSTANTFGIFDTIISRYADLTVYKSHSSASSALASNNSAGYQMMGVWNSLAAINSIKINCAGGGSFIIGSKITLYGVL